MHCKVGLPQERFAKLPALGVSGHYGHLVAYLKITDTMVTVFFDIDGTLISTAGAGGQAMVDTLAKQLGCSFDVGSVSFAGRTDRSLVAELLEQHNIEPTNEIFATFCEAFVPRLVSMLSERDGRVLPGVVDVLDKLSACDHIRLGIITGNLRKAAYAKLSHFDLAKYFYADGEPVGGFGDTEVHRDDVARSALRELSDLVGGSPKDRLWVVGDTASDIQCGQAINAQVVAVETGSFNREQLEPHGPDLILSDLTLAADWLDLLMRPE